MSDTIRAARSRLRHRRRLLSVLDAAVDGNARFLRAAIGEPYRPEPEAASAGAVVIPFAERLLAAGRDFLDA